VGVKVQLHMILTLVLWEKNPLLEKTVRRLDWLLSLISLSNPDFVVAGKVFLNNCMDFQSTYRRKKSLASSDNSAIIPCLYYP